MCLSNLISFTDSHSTSDHDQSNFFFTHSSTTSGTRTPQEVYTRLLIAKGHGLPLWRPSPNANPDIPTEIYDKGFGIGDVGIFRSDGQFDFLFNICYPAHDPINFAGVPDCFEQISLATDEVFKDPEHHRPWTDMVSSNIRKQDMNYRYVIFKIQF